MQGESPSPNRDNGICDEPGIGHCIFKPELGRVAWTEGWPNFFAAFLWDLTASASDDQGTQGTGRDFDPSSDLFHNHPTSIQELCEDLREMEPASIHRISEVYREQGIAEPQPDLRGTTVTIAATVRS